MQATGASCHEQVRFSSDSGGVDVETRKSTGTARLLCQGEISGLTMPCEAILRLLGLVIAFFKEAGSREFFRER